jgi:hypothetical protein
MSNVTCWLMVLAFVLGLLLTFALMIRRVKRQIPIYAAAGVKAPHVSAPDAPTAKLPHVSGPDAPTMEMPLASAPGAGAATVAGGAAAAKFTDVPPGPYGVGSAKAGVGGSGPEGWTIKGNEDSMLYHTPDSPSYKQTIAEVWFLEEAAAEKAGFTHWHKAHRGGTATFADVPPGPYGVGSAKPGVGGSGPEGWTIKGNEDSMLYHTPESPSYKQTIAEVWFNDEDVATKAGFTRWDKGRHPRS